MRVFQHSIIAVSLWVLNANAQSTISITPAASAAKASGASQYISLSFAGMGIEPSNLISFTGNSTPNELSINLLQNLANYSGAPPHLRIGGNTGDYMLYDASYDGWNLEKNPDATQSSVNTADEFLFGPRYLEALDRFPTGTPITYGLNLAYDQDDYIERIVTEAAAVLDQLNNTKVTSFEIGNEPDLYLQSWNELRTGTWNGATYTEQFLDRARAVYEQVLQPRGINGTFFDTAATASTISNDFTIQDLVNDGITQPQNGTELIASWDQHDYFYFIGVSTYPITLEVLMTLDNTDSQFLYWTTCVAAAMKTGLPYNLREMANVGPVGQQGISDTFGAALWQLHFFCYAASLNISTVGMHMTENSYAAPWQPGDMNGMGPHVRPSYYAFAAFAQLLGSGDGTTQISALPLSPSKPSVRVWAAYEQSVLSSLVIINSQQVNASAATKGSLTFSVSLPQYKGKTLYLSYLTADGADSTSNTTWNGLSFEQNSDGTPTIVDSSVHNVTIGSNGIATVTVRDSQAVIARLGSGLGSGAQSAVPSPSGSSSSSSSSSSSGNSGSGSDSSSSSGSSASSSSTHKSGAVELTSQYLWLSVLMALCLFWM